MNTIETIQHVREIDPDYPACTVLLKGRIIYAPGRLGQVQRDLRHESNLLRKTGIPELITKGLTGPKKAKM